MVVAEWQVGQLLWAMLWFTMFFLWIWVVITVFVDVFRSHDLGGLAKAVWTLFIIFLPVLGVLAYLIARGHKIGEHEARHARQTEQAMQTYIRSTVATPTTDLTALADLHARGVINDDELEAMKQRVVAAP